MLATLYNYVMVNSAAIEIGMGITLIVMGIVSLITQSQDEIEDLVSFYEESK